jgi:hypothetical protein
VALGPSDGSVLVYTSPLSLTATHRVDEVHEIPVMSRVVVNGAWRKTVCGEFHEGEPGVPTEATAGTAEMLAIPDARSATSAARA